MKLRALLTMLFSLMLLCGLATVTNAQTDYRTKAENNR